MKFNLFLNEVLSNNHTSLLCIESVVDGKGDEYSPKYFRRKQKY
jgi:hypothetical protein